MEIGWIGTGVMGLPMARHLQRAGHNLHVHNRTREKTEPLLQDGAEWCQTPAAVAVPAEIVFTVVGFPQDVESVYLGPEGVLSGNPAKCRIVVDMTTSQPALAQKIAVAAARKNIAALDAPVSGGDVGAKQGTLAIMTGGEPEVFREVLPLLEIMGRNIAYMGPAGSGQHTKMCNQILIAGTMIGVCESLLYAEKSGLRLEEVIDIIGKGAAASWSINNLGPRIAAKDFSPGFYVEHFVKDMEIALAEARRASLSLPGLALVHQLYVAVKAQGHGRDGTQALMSALKVLNGQGWQ